MNTPNRKRKNLLLTIDESVLKKMKDTKEKTDIPISRQIEKAWVGEWMKKK